MSLSTGAPDVSGKPAPLIHEPRHFALLDRIKSARIRVAVAYGVAGACHAAILTAIFAVGTIYVLAGAFAEVAIAVLNFHLLIPLALFLIFNLRYWRGVTALTMAVMVPVALAAVSAVF